MLEGISTNFEAMTHHLLAFNPVWVVTGGSNGATSLVRGSRVLQLLKLRVVKLVSEGW